MDNPVPRVKGQKITLLETEYILPPLPLTYMDDIQPLLDGGTTQNKAYVGALISAVHLSLLRNYPDMNRSVVADNLDMTNYADIVNAFMVTNKFTASSEVKSGELKASE
jgi:hypothetical protein